MQKLDINLSSIEIFTNLKKNAVTIQNEIFTNIKKLWKFKTNSSRIEILRTVKIQKKFKLEWNFNKFETTS